MTALLKPAWSKSVYLSFAEDSSLFSQEPDGLALSEMHLDTRLESLRTELENVILRMERLHSEQIGICNRTTGGIGREIGRPAIGPIQLHKEICDVGAVYDDQPVHGIYQAQGMHSTAVPETGNLGITGIHHHV